MCQCLFYLFLKLNIMYLLQFSQIVDIWFSLCRFYMSTDASYFFCIPHPSVIRADAGSEKSPQKYRNLRGRESLFFAMEKVACR